MSRKIAGKIRINGTLVAQTPISVGGIGDGEHVDLELAEDGTGRCYIPGTSLAGPMRAWLTSRLLPDPSAAPDDGPEDHPLIRALFGYVKDDEGQASALFVHDGPIEDAKRERRHGIAIDARTGAAKKGFFYTRALLPKGARLPLEMELDILEDYGELNPAAVGHPAGALACLVEALQDGEVRFGACKTRGMGRMKLEGLTIDHYDFAKDEDALNRWLNDAPSKANGLGVEALAPFPKPDLRRGRPFEIKIEWRAASPLMVKSGRDGMDTDMTPLMSGIEGGGLAPVIPGSSLKGVLRSQACKILNTLFGDPPEPPAPKKGDKDAASWPLLEDLFGSKDRSGRLRIDDLYYHASVPQEKWLDEDKAVMDTITERRQYVAIDRFTGGASDGALYSARPVKRGEGWDPIVLSLDASNAVSEANTLKELALLRLLVRDMEDGYIAIGFGARRGLGEIEVKDVAYSEGFPDDPALQAAWDELAASGGMGFDMPRD